MNRWKNPMTFFSECIGWVGNVAFLTGAVFLLKGRIGRCATMNFLGNAAYVVQAYSTSNWSLFWLDLSLGVIAFVTALKAVMLLTKRKGSEDP